MSATGNEKRQETTGPSIRYPPLHRFDRRLILVGLILLLIGGVAVYNINASHTYQSTFNVLPGKFFKITSNLRDQTLVTGNFRETNGKQVTFYIMNSIQFAAFQLSQATTTNLYSLANVSNGDVSFTSTLPDTYYLVFTHGTGSLNITETVFFQRTYISLDAFQVVSGIALLVLGGFVLYWGLRPKHRLPETVHTPQ